MVTPHQQQIIGQVQSAREQLSQQPCLPFAGLLKQERVFQVLQELNVSFRERVFSPLITVYAWLSQAVDSSPSCSKAVGRVLADRVCRGQPSCSVDDGGYCRARQRLSQPLLEQLTRQTAQELEEKTPVSWRWKRRQVKIFDGSTVLMPDTSANRKAYPKQKGMKAGVGFPILRLVVLVSLACGVVLDMKLGPLKDNSEWAMLRQMLEQVAGGDVILGDRGGCSYFNFAKLRERGADGVFRLHQSRKLDRSQAVSLGRDDWLVSWDRPQRPDWMSRREYLRICPSLTMRILRRHIAVKGFRTRVVWLATSLLDAGQYRAEELGDLFRSRWHVELDLRCIKSAMQMDMLGGQSPSIVRKEIWTHLLAYNLIRTLMAEAAQKHQLTPRELSFTGATQMLQVFAPVLGLVDASARERIWDILLQAIASRRVGKRPNRYEPRRSKRRGKGYKLLSETRKQARRRLLTSSSKP